MELTAMQVHGNVPVTVLCLTGRLDGSNYQDLIAEAKKLYEDGVRDLLFDLSQLDFISSAGLSSLHRVALLFQGKMSTELEEGWAEYRAMARDRDHDTQEHVKLLNPTKEVRQTLDLVGFLSFFEIYSDIKEAVASFQ